MQADHLLQLRRVPDSVHRELKARAAREGLSLQAYVLRELERIVARPTLAEVLDRVAARGPLLAAEDAATWRREVVQVIDAEREARADSILPSGRR